MLVVVDMQPGFSSSYSVVPQVKKAVRAARSRNEKILFLEYRKSPFKDFFGNMVSRRFAYGRTIDGIKQLVDGYSRAKVAGKYHDDGSDKVLKHLGSCRKITFCGVNGDACVLATVEGIHAKKSNLEINVIPEAIGWNSYVPKHERRFRDYPNVNIVHS